MLQDLEAGKPLEYEAFNGIVVELLAKPVKSADEPSLLRRSKVSGQENTNGKVAITICGRRNHMTRMVFLLLFIGAILVSGLAQAQTGKELVAKGQYIFETAGAALVTVSRKRLRTRAVALFRFLLAQPTARISHRTKRPVLVIGPINRFVTQWLKASDLMARVFYRSCPTKPTRGWRKKTSRR
jgi:hypothetical protein